MGDIFDSGSNCHCCDRHSDFDLCWTCEHEGWKLTAELVRLLTESVYRKMKKNGEIKENYNGQFSRITVITDQNY
jgi:hypothetical protein